MGIIVNLTGALIGESHSRIINLKDPKLSANWYEDILGFKPNLHRRSCCNEDCRTISNSSFVELIVLTGQDNLIKDLYF